MCAQAPLRKGRRAPPRPRPKVNSLPPPPMQWGGTDPKAKVQYLSQNGYSLSLSLSRDRRKQRSGCPLRARARTRGSRAALSPYGFTAGGSALQDLPFALESLSLGALGAQQKTTKTKSKAATKKNMYIAASPEFGQAWFEKGANEKHAESPLATSRLVWLRIWAFLFPRIPSTFPLKQVC